MPIPAAWVGEPAGGNEKLRVIRDLGLPADILGSFHLDPGQAVPPAGRDRDPLGASAASGEHPPALAEYSTACSGRPRSLMAWSTSCCRITHRITVRAERRIVQDLLDDIQQVQGKTRHPVPDRCGGPGNPDGTMRDVIFPGVDETVCETLVKEQSAGGANHNWMAGLFDDAPVDEPPRRRDGC